MRGLGGSSSIKTFRMEEGKREKVIGREREDPGGTIAPSKRPTSLISWRIVVDPGFWGYQCEKVFVEGVQRGDTAGKSTWTYKHYK